MSPDKDLINQIKSNLEAVPGNKLDLIAAFISEIIEKQPKKPKKQEKIQFGWAGALEDMDISSVELQKKSLEWM